jgi:ferredoxin-type protein NapH
MRFSKPNGPLLILSGFFTAAAAVTAIRILPRAGPPALNVALLGLGISLGPCLAAYALVPARQRQAARKVVLFTGGLTILAFSLLASANLDLEGVFLLLFEGVAGAAVGHTLATLIVGPLFFGRFLCGWGCWRAMVLELLPVGPGSGRHKGIWFFLPFAGLAATMFAAAIGYYLFGDHAGGSPASPYTAGTRFLLGGIAIYYAASIGLAFALIDQRAFCKYLCPNAAILRYTSRLSLLKMAADLRRCNGCGACSKVCPMDIDVKAFALSGRRVGSGECILCQRCVQACPTGALTASFRPRARAMHLDTIESPCRRANAKIERNTPPCAP